MNLSIHDMIQEGVARGKHTLMVTRRPKKKENKKQNVNKLSKKQKLCKAVFS